jgi:hypothetical protein
MALYTLAVITQFGQAEEDGKLTQLLVVLIFTTEIHKKYNPLAP